MSARGDYDFSGAERLIMRGDFFLWFNVRGNYRVMYIKWKELLAVKSKAVGKTSHNAVNREPSKRSLYTYIYTEKKHANV